MVGEKTSGPSWPLVRTAMPTAARTAPAGSSAYPVASGHGPRRGPSCGDAGTAVPSRATAYHPAVLTVTGAADPGARAGTRPSWRDGRGGGGPGACPEAGRYKMTTAATTAAAATAAAAAAAIRPGRARRRLGGSGRLMGG